MTHAIRSVETPARYDRLERFADQLRDWGCQRFPEERVLIEIEVDAIDATGRRNCLGIEARTVQRSADLAVRLCKPYAFLRGARELRSDCAFRVTIGGGATIKTGGTGIPGSTGACRLVRTSVATPSAACHAVCGCTDWKSFVPSVRMTSASGECISTF